MSERRSRLPVLGQVEEPVERKDAQRNRIAILEAARKLLKTKPISEICMDQLADEAGVGKGTLYRRFKDRSSLCLALIDDAAKALQQQVISGLSLPPDSPPNLRLRTFIRALLRFTLDNAPLLAEAETWAQREAPIFEHPSQTWAHFELVRLMRACQPPPQDPELLAYWVQSVLNAQLFTWQLARGESAENIARSAECFLMRGIGHA